MTSVSEKVLEEAVAWITKIQNDPNIKAFQNTKGIVSFFDSKTGVCRYQMTPAIWQAVKTRTSMRVPIIED